MRSAVESSGRGRRRRRSPKARECENLLSVEPAARAPDTYIGTAYARRAFGEACRASEQARRALHINARRASSKARRPFGPVSARVDS